MSEKPEDSISPSSVVRAEQRRGNPLDAVTTPPVFCYRPHASEILKLCRLIFIMTPVREFSMAYQLPDDGPIILAYMASHPTPIPQDIWDKLAGRTLYMKIGGDKENQPEGSDS